MTLLGSLLFLGSILGVAAATGCVDEFFDKKEMGGESPTGYAGGESASELTAMLDSKTQAALKLEIEAGANADAQVKHQLNVAATASAQIEAQAELMLDYSAQLSAEARAQV
ncbi:MAG TPA: hypothetical protein VGB18_04645, partial [Candidatus Thermoplasmatota archaeon]